MATAAATICRGSSSQQPVRLPDWLLGQFAIGGLNVCAYRLLLIALVVAITLVLGYLVERTRYGELLRAAVDNRR